VKILDCTLRDGGYYNDWNFDSNLIEEYFLAMARSGIEMIEVGFKNYPEAGFKGASYYCTEEYLTSINIPANISIGVMLEASSILNSKKDVKPSVRELFVESKDSKIDFVRIACHFNSVEKTKEIAFELAALGYKVFVNLMQVSLKTNSEIANVLKSIDSWGLVSCMYFADSLGNMNDKQTTDMVSIFKKNWKGEIGVHMHNNKGLALSNTMAALNADVEYVDVTVSGMGRGAGNAEAELLIAELKGMSDSKYDLYPVAKLAIEHFHPMKLDMKWGPSLHYFLAAKYNIHPTYIQRILTDSHYGLSEHIGIIKYLHKLSNQSNFQEEVLSNIFSSDVKHKAGVVDQYTTLSSIEVKASNGAIILGSGQSISKYLDSSYSFIRKSGATVFSVNNAHSSLVDSVDYSLYLHNAKQMGHDFHFQLGQSKAIIPVSRFSDAELSGINKNSIINFPVEVNFGELESSINGCTIPFDLTAAYAISAVKEMGYQKVYLIGFDGYDYMDSRQREMSELFFLAREKWPKMTITSLTPTTYPIEQGSLYAPIFRV